jgi:hypothetical protein
MVKRVFVLFALLTCLRGAALAADPAGPAPDKLPDYLRYAEDAVSARLEVAIRRFSLPSGQTVDLVGAVHIADAPYYQELNRRFTTYDAVLFELVGDPRHLTRAPPADLDPQSSDSSGGTVSFIQQAASKYLKLTFQLSAIDYSGKNMVHADMSYEEFERLQAARGENMATLFMRAMQAQANGSMNDVAMDELNTFALIRILMSPDAATEFKKALAKVFDQTESLTLAMEGQSGSTILSGRNEVAVKKMKEVLADKRRRRIAVFYGGAHMPGIEAVLTKDLGARSAGEEWLPAWTMPKAKPAAVTTPPADKTPAPGTAKPAS